MMITDGFWSRERIWAVGIALLIEGALFYLILTAHAQLPSTRNEPRQVLLDIIPPPLPPVVRPPEIKPKQAKASGAASPPNLQARATPIVLPRPIVPPLVVPPTIATAPIPATGVDPSAGASNRRGEGSGSGGQGNGTGNGDAGDGEGDGGDIPPRQVRGKINRSDYPQQAGELDRELSVSVLYRVEVDGHVDDCRVTRSSGRTILDDTVCRLIEERFRFVPSRDFRGTAVPSTVDGDYSWAPTRG